MFVILILARLMHTMLYYSGSLGLGFGLMLTMLATTAIELILSMPLVAFICGENPDVAEEIGGNGGVSRFIKLAYAGFFLYICSGTLNYFAEFMTVEFPKVGSAFLIIVILASASGYCAYLGIEGIARAGTVILGVVVVLVLTMAAVSEGVFDPLNVLPLTVHDIPDMFTFAIRDLSSSWWLPMLAALAPYLRGDGKKTVLTYLLTKLAMLESLILLVALVLGGFAEVIGYPLLALGAYAKTNFIQHFDAINMLVWTLNGVIVNGTYIFISAESAKKKSRVLSVILSTAVVAAVGIFTYYNSISYRSDAANIFKLAAIAVLGIILPLFAVIARKIKAAKAKAVLRKENC